MTNESLFRFKIPEDMNLNNNIDIKIAENNLLSETLLYRYEKSKGLPKLTAFLNGNIQEIAKAFLLHKQIKSGLELHYLELIFKSLYSVHCEGVPFLKKQKFLFLS